MLGKGPAWAHLCLCQKNRTDNLSGPHLPLRTGKGRGLQFKEIRFSLEATFSSKLASLVHDQQRAMETHLKNPETISGRARPVDH